MKCLEVPDETKLLTDSDICFGYKSIRTWGKFFKMTQGILEKCVHACVANFSKCIV
jgi:hypothetical protein